MGMIVVNRCFEAYIDGLLYIYMYTNTDTSVPCTSVCHLKLEVDFCVAIFAEHFRVAF